MNILALPKMIFSYTEGWDDLVRMRPTVAKMFALFVLPMSLIPPLMIFYAGSKYGAEALPHMSSQDLQLIMAIFFLAEIVAVPIVALLIQRLGEVVEIRPSYQDAFLLAAVAPTPLWLAALVLFIPRPDRGRAGDARGRGADLSRREPRVQA
jgi:MFS family permease